MATPRLKPGDWGKIRTYQRGDKWMAVCQHCDHRGKVRQRSKTGRSRAAAMRALDEALTREQGTEIAPKLNGRTRLRELAEIMLAEKRSFVDVGQMSPWSLRTYEGRMLVWQLPTDMMLERFPAGL